MISLEEYKEKALINVKKTSRTANGILDVSTSDTKKDAICDISLDKAKQLAINNYLEAIEYAYDNKNRVFKDYKEVKEFILDIGRIINKGIVKEGSLIRSGSEDKKYYYEKIANLEEAFDIYAKAYLEYFDKDVIEAAAFAEYYMNMKIHLFADGCGKSSKVLSAYMLIRKDHKLPVYGDMEEYFKFGPSIVGNYFSKEDNEEFNRFVKYYRTLFSE